MSDLYVLLELSPEASPDDIKRAYRRKAREHHPDAGGDEETFKALTHAYQVLSDPQKRARYDRFGDDDTPSTRGAGQDPFGFGAGGFGDVGDIIDAFFGAGASGRRAGGAARNGRNQPGRDVLVTVQLSLEEVVTGAHREVEIDVARNCDQCGGSGSNSGQAPVRCETCGGAGQVQKIMRTALGRLATAAPCSACQGNGSVIADPCTGCVGEGRRPTHRTIGIDIPPGVKDGDRIPVRGEGEVGRLGARAGDLYVQVAVAEHELFVREGRTLSAQITVPMTQAALGGTVTVPVIAGDDVEVDVPAGTQSGDVLTMRRAGVPMPGGGRRGDLKLIVQVEVPTGLDERQRALLAELAELRGEPLASKSGLFDRLRDAFQR